MDGVSASPVSKRVGIVTVSFHSGVAIRELLSSLPVATSQPTEIIVVDNVPGGDADLAASLRGTSARIVSRPDNPGYGGGVNAGVSALGSDVELFLVVNPDVVLDKGSLDELVAVIQGDDTIGSAGPKIRDHHGTVYPSARSIPSLRVGTGHALLGDLVPSNPWTRKYHAFADYEVQREAGWLSGACVLVRRSAFEDVGGFDDEFFMYFEDVDLGYRLGRAGWRNVLVPTATVQHEGGHSTRNHSARMVAAHHASARLWIRKRYAGFRWWPVRAIVATGLVIRQAVKTRDR